MQFRAKRIHDGLVMATISDYLTSLVPSVVFIVWSHSLAKSVSATPLFVSN